MIFCAGFIFYITDTCRLFIYSRVKANRLTHAFSETALQCSKTHLEESAPFPIHECTDAHNLLVSL